MCSCTHKRVTARCIHQLSDGGVDVTSSAHELHVLHMKPREDERPNKAKRHLHTHDAHHSIICFVGNGIRNFSTAVMRTTN